MVGYNRPSVLDRAIASYPPLEFGWETLFLDASSSCLSRVHPSQNNVTSYDATKHYPVASDETSDRSAFRYVFDKYTELCGFSKVQLYMSTDDHDDMDVYVVIKKLDRQGNVLTHQNIPMEDLPQGTKLDDIPYENYWQYVGPNGRLRASHRAVSQEKDYDPTRLSLLSKAYVYHPHDRKERIEPGHIVKLDIMLWPGGMIFDEGESMSLQVMGHVPIIPEFVGLEKSMPVVNKGRHKIHCGPDYPSALLVALA
jgi:predicted acyl esterase